MFCVCFGNMNTFMTKIINTCMAIHLNHFDSFQLGDTSVLVAVTSKLDSPSSSGFLPLTVNTFIYLYIGD